MRNWKMKRSKVKRKDRLKIWRGKTEIERSRIPMKKRKKKERWRCGPYTWISDFCEMMIPFMSSESLASIQFTCSRRVKFQGQLAWCTCMVMHGRHTRGRKFIWSYISRTISSNIFWKAKKKKTIFRYFLCCIITICMTYALQMISGTS